jgi:hypothetical protein
VSTLERAIVIAVEAHAGQVDKGGAPYVLHPLRMMLSMTSTDERIVAVLHDVCEDCPGWTFDRLRREGFSDHIIEALHERQQRYFADCCTDRTRLQTDRAIPTRDRLDQSASGMKSSESRSRSHTVSPTIVAARQLIAPVTDTKADDWRGREGPIATVMRRRSNEGRQRRSEPMPLPRRAPRRYEPLFRPGRAYHQRSWTLSAHSAQS